MGVFPLSSIFIHSTSYLHGHQPTEYVNITGEFSRILNQYGQKGPLRLSNTGLLELMPVRTEHILWWEVGEESHLLNKTVKRFREGRSSGSCLLFTIMLKNWYLISHSNFLGSASSQMLFSM